MRDGLVRGEEFGQALVDVVAIGVNGLNVRFLIYLYLFDGVQQFAVGLEEDAVDVDVAPEVAVLGLSDFAFERGREGADERQMHGLAFLELVQEDALEVVQRTQQRAR